MNIECGHAPPDPGLARLQSHSTFTIPWMEDDGGAQYFTLKSMCWFFISEVANMHCKRQVRILYNFGSTGAFKCSLSIPAGTHQMVDAQPGHLNGPDRRLRTTPVGASWRSIGARGDNYLHAVLQFIAKLRHLPSGMGSFVV